MTPNATPDITLRLTADAVADAHGVHAPGCLLLRCESAEAMPGDAIHAHLRVLAVGSPEAVARHPDAATATPAEHPGHLLIPGLVNAHTHLDLTHIGPQPHNSAGGFASFVDLVRTRRHADPAAIAESVREGVRLSLAAGVVAVGDIAGAPRGRPSPAAFHALASTAIHGVSYIEFFAIGRTEQAALGLVEAIARDLAPSRARVRPGLSPHATYSVSPAAYRRAFSLAQELQLPVATHVAETPDERGFIAHATGPQRVLLEAVGAWDDCILADFGHGRTPIEHFARAIGSIHRTPPVSLAHVHDLGPDAATLAKLGASVIYCPRAGEYFGAASHFGPHRYREMLALGLNVALGTDSVINLPTAAISIWDEMRLLYRRDGTDAATLLRMATVNGAKALGLAEHHFAFAPGQSLAGLARVPFAPGSGDPVVRALRSGGNPKLLYLGK